MNSDAKIDILIDDVEFGNISSLILPVATGYLKDITGSFLPALIMLAVIEGLIVPLGLAMKETGRRRQNMCLLLLDKREGRSPA